MEMGAVDILIVWENLDMQRFTLKNHQTDGKSYVPFNTASVVVLKCSGLC